MAKTLIAFFSRADENYFSGAMRYVKVGNTEIVVNQMKDMISADTFKIEMKNPYSPVYMTCIEEAKKDLREKARPELTTYLEHYDFSGKTILPLCTNEGSGMGGSEREIRKLVPGADVKKGLPIHGSEAANSAGAVKKWLATNGLL
ncbi:MAG: flavodoxin [Firmicutes bacterium]|nr:flavodoxin [Bacillota bacterium]